MLISDAIAQIIEEMLDKSPGWLDIQRNDLANTVGCVPSQINYVIASRFTPSRGYIVESRRGGGGYIRITRVRMDRQQLFMHLLSAVGDEIDVASANAILRNLRDNELISPREEALLSACVSDRAMENVPPEHRSAVRGSIFRTALLRLYSIET